MAAKARSTDVQISKAFQDLDALMEMAKPMVALGTIHIIRKHFQGEGVQKHYFFLTFLADSTFTTFVLGGIQ